MKGFEININGEDSVFVSSDSIVSVELYIDNIDKEIVARGKNTKQQRFIWVRKKLDIGDKVKIKVTEIEEVTPPIKSCPVDRTGLLELYLQLKKELEEKGLIK
ncbi:hypothetical protein [Coprobacter sp.]